MMTENEKDDRIAQLEEALRMCNDLLTKEFAARRDIEDKYMEIAGRLILGTQPPRGLKQMALAEFQQLDPRVRGKPVCYAVWPKEIT